MEDEEIEIREYDWRLLKRLLVYLKPYQGRILFAFCLMLATAGLQATTLFLVKAAIDTYITNHDLSGLGRISLVYLLVLMGQMILGYLQVFIMQMTGQHIMYDMRVQIFSHLQKLEINFFHKNPVGR